jgi:hypothetical protein
LLPINVISRFISYIDESGSLFYDTAKTQYILSKITETIESMEIFMECLAHRYNFLPIIQVQDFIGNIQLVPENLLKILSLKFG